MGPFRLGIECNSTCANRILLILLGKCTANRIGNKERSPLRMLGAHGNGANTRRMLFTSTISETTAMWSTEIPSPPCC